MKTIQQSSIENIQGLECFAGSVLGAPDIEYNKIQSKFRPRNYQEPLNLEQYSDQNVYPGLIQAQKNIRTWRIDLTLSQNISQVTINGSTYNSSEASPTSQFAQIIGTLANTNRYNICFSYAYVDKNIITIFDEYVITRSPKNVLSIEPLKDLNIKF